MSSHSQGSAEVRWLSEDEQQAWRSLQLMHLRLDAALARRLAQDSGLSYPDYLVLVALTDADAPAGALRARDLQDRLGWEQSRVSHHVRRMEDRGLVLRRPLGENGRGLLVEVTAEGRRQIEAAAPGHVDAVRRLFLDHLDDAQVAAVGVAARAVLDALDRMDSR